MGGFRPTNDYLAGLFEAEGYVCNVQKHIQFSFINTDHEPVLMFRDIFGGTVFGRVFPGTKWKKSWRWRSSNLTSPEFLEVLGKCHTKSKILQDRPAFVLTDEYVAGLFDGDGSVMIPKRSIRGACALRVSITSENYDELELVRTRYGGGIYHDKRKRCCFYWIAVAKVAESFLLKIGPFSTMKKERIRLSLELPALNQQLWHCFRTKQQPILDAMLNIRGQVMAMNRRGV